MTTKLTYVGVHAEGVEITDLPDAPLVYPGDRIDVPDELAERLLEQPANWKRAGGRQKADPEQSEPEGDEAPMPEEAPEPEPDEGPEPEPQEAN